MMLGAVILPLSMADVWLNPINPSALAKCVRRMLALFHPLCKERQVQWILILIAICGIDGLASNRSYWGVCEAV